MSRGIAQGRSRLRRLWTRLIRLVAVLAVAIPAVAAYNFYQRHTRSVLGNTDALSNVLLAHLCGESPAQGQAKKPAADAEDD